MPSCTHILITCRALKTGFFKKGHSPTQPIRPTGVTLDTIKHIGNVMSASPGGDFKIHGGKSTSKLVVVAQWLEHSLYAIVALLFYENSPNITHDAYSKYPEKPSYFLYLFLA